MDWLEKVWMEVQDEIDHETAHPQPKVDHTPAELDEASMDLLRAAAYMEEHGWLQGGLQSSDGRVCMVGAVEAVTGTCHGPAARKLQDALNGMCGVWNDADGRTAAEAVAKMRAVALGIV